MPNGGHYNRKTQLRKQPAWPAMKRRLERGATKLARQHARDTERANRISLHHPTLVAADPASVSGPHATSIDHQTQENAA